MLHPYNMFGLEDQIGMRVHFMSPGFGERAGGATPIDVSRRPRRKRREGGLSPMTPDEIKAMEEGEGNEPPKPAQTEGEKAA